MLASISRWFSCWRSFFSPVPGWKQRYLAFKGGKTTWAVPDRPESPQVIPFPVQWIPHRLSVIEDPEDVRLRGFAFLKEVISAESGTMLTRDDAVACLRCGIHLSAKEAHMIGGFDPPYCKRCHWPLLITGR